MLEKRSYEAEMMDELEMGGADMAKTLDELEIINRKLGGYSVVTNGIEKLLREKPASERSITLADLGCGGGDTLRFISRWAKQKNIDIQMVGIDANEFIVKFAEEKSKHFPEISYMQMDIFSEEFSSKKYDIITASLFTHHFTDEQLIKLFSQIKNQVRLGVIINDLHRHPLAYYSIKYITKFFAKSPLIKNDAPLSVARAFTKKDIVELMAKSGITNYSIQWRWAFRWQVIFK
ncbi:MAG: methyltransferase domain-containing protein [Bacteroidia bacterium]